MQLPNIPFELILFILFFALPALGNLLGKRREGAEREKKAETNPRPAEANKTQPTPTSTSRPNSQPTSTEDWLEQARRRVAEAQGREAAGRGTSSPPASPPLLKPRQPTPQQSTANRPARTRTGRTRPSLEGRSLEERSPENRSLEPRNLGKRPNESRSLEGASLEGRSAEQRREPFTSLETPSLERSIMPEAPPIHVQRLERSRRATIEEQSLRFDPGEVTKGLIWHQVLSPPRATLRRTRLSRRRP